MKILKNKIINNNIYKEIKIKLKDINLNNIKELFKQIDFNNLNFNLDRNINNHLKINNLLKDFNIGFKINLIKNISKKKTVYLIYNKQCFNIYPIKIFIENIVNISKHNVKLLDCNSIMKLDYNNLKILFKKSIIIINYCAQSIFINDNINNRYLYFFIRNFKGMKILICQDEYDYIKERNNFINFTNINIVLTCCPNKESKDKIYYNVNKNVKFINILTGYTNKLKGYKLIKDKKIDIFYRGRLLNPSYGELGFLKYEIGEIIKKYAKNEKLNLDIDSRDCMRLKESWINTLSNSKITLATPSGCNVLNKPIINCNMMNNDLVKDNMYSVYNRKIFEQFRIKHNIKEDLNFEQISPKMFEAIALGTVLIMYEGQYSNILIPNVHFIELKRDHSNINDIIEKIKDDDYLQNIADKAYNDIIKKKKYSYKKFVRLIDYIVS